MKKFNLKKLLSICAGFALALVAVVTFGAYGKNLTAQAEEPEVPDTSTWEEVDANVGYLLTGVWYRAYFGEDYFTEILTFNSENYTTNYQNYDENNVPEDAKIPSITLRACKQEEVLIFSGSSNKGSCNLKDIIPYSITETYIEFYIPTSLEVDMGPQYCAGPQVTIDRVITLDEDAKITTVNSELKKLVEPTDEPTTPDDSTPTPDDNSESKQEVTDKFSNWLNTTFGLNTTGSVIGSIALIVAGFFIVKALFGKK